jgi:hypothetical protein
VQKDLDWLEDSVKGFEPMPPRKRRPGAGRRGTASASAKDERPPDGVVPDAGKLAARERKRLKALETRGRKAIGDDPGNQEGDWLTEVVEDFGGRIDELESEGTRRQAADVKKQLDWLQQTASSASRSRRQAQRPTRPRGKKPTVARIRRRCRRRRRSTGQVMAELRKLAGPRARRRSRSGKAASRRRQPGDQPQGHRGRDRRRSTRSWPTSRRPRRRPPRSKAEAVKVRADAAKAKREAKKAGPNRRSPTPRRKKTFDLTSAGGRTSRA